jgi:hypothetical protein
MQNGGILGVRDERRDDARGDRCARAIVNRRRVERIGRRSIGLRGARTASEPTDQNDSRRPTYQMPSATLTSSDAIVFGSHGGVNVMSTLTFLTPSIDSTFD